MENLVGNPMFTRYRVALAGLCSCCAELAHVKTRMIDGEVILDEEVQLICEKLSYSKEEFLRAKESLGFTDGLAFMENNRFAGFSIRDGCLIGDPSKAYLILRPWYEDPAKVNNYQFEVANYLLAFMGLHTSQLQQTVCMGESVCTPIPLQKRIRRTWLKLKRLMLL